MLGAFGTSSLFTNTSVLTVKNHGPQVDIAFQLDVYDKVRVMWRAHHPSMLGMLALPLIGFGIDRNFLWTSLCGTARSSPSFEIRLML